MDISTIEDDGDGKVHRKFKWNKMHCIILYHGKSEIYFLTQRNSICKYMITEQSYYYFDTGKLSPDLHLLFNDLLKYKRNQILNRFHTTIIKQKTTTNNNKIIKSTYLVILDIPSQIIHKISLLDRSTEYPYSPGTVLSYLTAVVTFNKGPLFVLLKLCSEPRTSNNNHSINNKLYGIAMNIKDNSYHQIIYEDSKSIDTSWGIEPMISTKASDLYAHKSLDLYSKWIITNSNFYPKYYIKYIIGNHKTYLLHWSSLFTMNLITFNINTVSYDVERITLKPAYSAKELLRLCASNTNSNFKDNIVRWTIWSRLLLFITPLYDNNFYIAFFDINIWQIYLYHLHDKQMIKCNNDDLLSRLKSTITFSEQQSDTLSINITDTVDNKILVSGYVRLTISTTNLTIPQIIEHILIKYCRIQQIYISRCNVGEIISFNVDELFIY